MDILIARFDAKFDSLNQNISGFRESMAEFKGGIKVRVDQLESDARTQKWWTTFKIVCVLPITAILHQVAAHFGWIK